MIRTLLPRVVALLVLSLSFLSDANAAENGGASTPNGADGFLAGALPPPGVYNLLFFNQYNSDRFNDGNGNALIPGFKVNASVLADKILYMSNDTFLGGSFGVYAADAFIDETVHVAGASDSRAALGDLEGGPIVGWHNGDYHSYGLLTIVVPTGSYDKTRLANTGNNYAVLRPQYGFSWLPASGWDVSARFSYSFNAKNQATDYQSGQYFHSDFNVGHAIGDSWKLGLQGYFLTQTTDDTVDGTKVGSDGFRGHVLAIGPGAVYQAKGASIEVRYLKEYEVRNRAAGDSFWVKIVWKL